jgi:hypothetical protein
MSLAAPSERASHPDDMIESWDDDWQNPAQDAPAKAADWAGQTARGLGMNEAFVFAEQALAFAQTSLVLAVSGLFVYLFGEPVADTGFQLLFETTILGIESARAQVSDILAFVPFLGIMAPTADRLRGLQERQEALLDRYNSRDAQAGAGRVLPGNALGARSGSGFEVVLVVEAPAAVDSGNAWGFHGALRIPILISDAGEFSGHLAKLITTSSDEMRRLNTSIHAIEAGRRLSVFAHALQLATDARHTELRRFTTAGEQLRSLQPRAIGSAAGPPQLAGPAMPGAAGTALSARSGPGGALSARSGPPSAADIAVACPELSSLRLVKTPPQFKTSVGMCLAAVYLKVRKLQLESLSACRAPGAVASLWTLMAEREITLLRGAHGETGIASAVGEISRLMQLASHVPVSEKVGRMAEIVCEQASDPFTAFARLYVAEEALRAKEELEEALEMQASGEGEAALDSDTEADASASDAPAAAAAAAETPPEAAQAAAGLFALASGAAGPGFQWIGQLFEAIHGLFGGIDDCLQDVNSMSAWIAAEVAAQMGVSPLRSSAAEGWARWSAAHNTSLMLLLELFGRDVDARLGAGTRAMFTYYTGLDGAAASTTASGDGEMAAAASEHVPGVAPIDIGAEMLYEWGRRTSKIDAKHPTRLPDECSAPIERPRVSAAAGKEAAAWRNEAEQRRRERAPGDAAFLPASRPRAEQRARFHLHIAACTPMKQRRHDPELQVALDASTRARQDLRAQDQVIGVLEEKLQSCRQAPDAHSATLGLLGAGAATDGGLVMLRASSSDAAMPATVARAVMEAERHRLASGTLKSHQRAHVAALVELLESEVQDAAFDAATSTPWTLRPLLADDKAVSRAVMRGWDRAKSAQQATRKANNMRVVGSRLLALLPSVTPRSTRRKHFPIVNADADMEFLRAMLRTRNVAAAVRDAAAHATSKTQLRTSTLSFLPQLLWRGALTGATALLVNPSARSHLDQAIAQSVAASSAAASAQSTASQEQAAKALASADPLVLQSVIAQSSPVRRRRHSSGLGPPTGPH